VLVSALLADKNFADASKEIDTEQSLAAKCENRQARLDFAIVAARVRAASGTPADQAVARQSLERIRREAIHWGIVGTELEAWLAIGEIEMKSNHTTTGRAQLISLGKEARGKGFLLVAEKATAAAKG